MAKLSRLKRLEEIAEWAGTFLDRRATLGTIHRKSGDAAVSGEEEESFRDFQERETAAKKAMDSAGALLLASLNCLKRGV